MATINRAYLMLGSNIAPTLNLRLAVAYLAELGQVIAVSSVVESPAIGPDRMPDPSYPSFLNAAVALDVALSAPALRTALREIETRLGRERTADKYAPRPIDIDIALFNNEQITEADFTIPDPDILQRSFLAGPLAELAPTYCHPETGETLQTIATRLGAGTLKQRPDVILTHALL